jgi:hypothetical protein
VEQLRKGFLIYEERRKYFPIYEEAVSNKVLALQLLHSEFPHIWGKFSFLFISERRRRGVAINTTQILLYMYVVFVCHFYVLTPPPTPAVFPFLKVSVLYITV